MSVLHIGDTVTGEYHGAAFAGVVHAYDGSGYLYVKPAQGFAVYGVARDQIAFAPGDPDRARLRVTARPDAAPELRAYPEALMGLVCAR